MSQTSKTFRTPKCRDSCKECEEWACLGQRLAKWFDDFFSAVVAVGTLGAGFTFSVIFSSLETLDGTIDTNVVRHFLVTAWLLFVVAVAVASACAALFRFIRPELIEGFNKYGDVVNLVAAIISVVLQLLIVAAFLMSARALRRYDEPSGKAAVVIISLIGCVLFIGWILRAL
jgi:uncharacterized membrane protein YidH (DUF202 family)